MENNCQLLRVLLKLLESSRDSVTLAVGCTDLAHLVAHVPHGARARPCRPLRLAALPMPLPGCTPTPCLLLPCSA